MKYCVGMKSTICRKVVEKDVLAFAELTGDKNPVHVNKDAALASIFHGQVAHGMYTASLISTVIGMQMPGEGTIYLSQNCRFKKPVYFGDVLNVVVEIMSIDEKNRATLLTQVYNQNNDLVLDGTALVLLPRED